MLYKSIGRTCFPTLILDYAIIKLKDLAVSSKLDLTKAFHQLDLAPESRSITTFQSETHIKHFTRLNFGVISAQEELQNALRDVLKDIEGTLNITEDVLVFASNTKQHDLVLHKV